MCLDTHAFRLTQSSREAFGCAPECRRGLADISATRSDVPDASIWHSGFSRHSIPLSAVEAGDDDDDQDDPYMDDSDELDEDVDESELFDYTDEEAGDDDSETYAVEAEEGHHTGVQPPTEPHTAQSSLHPLSLNPNVTVQFETSPRRVPVRQMMDRARTELAVRDKFSESKQPSFAVIHTSETNIRFLQDAMKDPTVIFRHPLIQNLPPNLQALARFDRLNMLAQIPELGVVAIATQTGRVGLLALTRMPSSKQLAFRLDAIVPFESQELEGCRPDAPLLGMALGPIQGRELSSEDAGSDNPSVDGQSEMWRGVECSRRYRLMLTYYDHTVLSYEIDRTTTARSGMKDELLVF